MCCKLEARGPGAGALDLANAGRGESGGTGQARMGTPPAPIIKAGQAAYAALPDHPRVVDIALAGRRA